jgi:hypothetical protein
MTSVHPTVLREVLADTYRRNAPLIADYELMVALWNSSPQNRFKALQLADEDRERATLKIETGPKK